MNFNLLIERLATGRVVAKKVLCLSFLLLLLITVGVESANAQNQESVYLKNGSVLRGVITEQIIGQSIKLQMSDGSVWVFSYDEIEKITKETVEKQSYVESINPKTENKILHYEGGVSLFTSGLGIGVWTSHGCAIMSYLYTGAGIGFGAYFGEYDRLSLPVFGDIRGYFRKQGIKPYINMRLGYDIFNDGIYVNPTVGFRYKLLDVSIGYSMTQCDFRYDYYEYDHYDGYYYRAPVHNFVMNIGLRF